MCILTNMLTLKMFNRSIGTSFHADVGVEDSIHCVGRKKKNGCASTPKQGKK